MSASAEAEVFAHQSGVLRPFSCLFHVHTADLPVRDRVRSTVLASRQQTCLHPTVSKMQGMQGNNGCKALVAAKKCNW